MARFTKERDIEGDELVTWRRKERALMSDGTVLEKLTVRFKASTYSAAYLHNYGWKVRGKLKATATAATWAQSYRDMGWTTTSGEPAEVAKPKVSARQIEAACQADDGSGFCRTCGAHVYGIEPDARGYTCEGCGKPEVYGAEELLLMGA